MLVNEYLDQVIKSRAYKYLTSNHLPQLSRPSTRARWALCLIQMKLLSASNLNGWIKIWFAHLWNIRKCETMKFRPDIEGLRAVAVVFVILSHLQLSGNLFSGGFVGVDIFFVISGYLITSLLMHEYSKNAKANKGSGWISLRTFYFRRARRLLPAAIVVLFATVLFSYIFLSSVKAGQTLIQLLLLFYCSN